MAQTTSDWPRRMSPAANTPFDQRLFQLEIGNAIGQQAADAVIALEHGHLVPGPVKPLGAGQSGWPRADHGHAFAGARHWRAGGQRSFSCSEIGDQPLQRPDPCN